MDEKTNEILKTLLQSKTAISSNKLAEILDVSIRTIKRCIKELPETIESINLNVSADKNGYKLILSDSDKVKLLEILKNEDISLNSHQLEGSICIYILLNNKTTLEDIGEYLFYSKNTVIKKIDKLRNELLEFNLEIVTSQTGLEIVGEELNIRRALTHYLNLTNKNNITLIEKYLDNPNLIEQIYQLVIKELINNEISFSEEQIHLILKNILVSLLRYSYEIDISFIESYLAYKNYIVVKNISNSIQKMFNLTINDNDMFYLSVLFGNTMFTEKKELEIRMAILYSIEKLEKQYNESFIENNRFISNLQKHVMFSIQRLNINAHLQNPLKSMIKNKYFLAYEYATYFSNELKNILGIHFSDEEISYIALHFQSYLEEKKEEEIYEIIIVCENGVESIKYFV